MMQIFNNKSIVRKIIIALIILILFNFAFPVYSNAATQPVGTLFTPVKKFVAAIGDVAINMLQKTFLEGAPTAVAKRSMASFVAAAAFKERTRNYRYCC
jgi:hypothetical protein